MINSPPPYLRLFEFHSPDPDGGSLIVSETRVPDRVLFHTTLSEVTLTENQCRALSNLLSAASYGQNLRFEPNPETSEELTQ